MHLSELLHRWNEQDAPGLEVLASPAISKGLKTATDNHKVKFREGGRDGMQCLNPKQCNDQKQQPDQMVAEACLCRSLIESMWRFLALKVWHAHSTVLAMESRPHDQGQDHGIWVSHQQHFPKPRQPTFW